MRRTATLVILALLAAGTLLSGCASRVWKLPVAFTGLLPCADCPGIRWTLNLFGEGVFHERLEYLESSATGGSSFFDDAGRWAIVADGSVLELTGEGGTPQRFAIRGRDTLRKLGGEGRPIESKLNFDLKRVVPFAPLEHFPLPGPAAAGPPPGSPAVR